MKVSKEHIISEIKKELGTRELEYFTKYTYDKYEFTKFHLNYCKILQLFAEKKIKKLIISAPPQHGKSELSTRRLPSFLFGLNPDLRVVVGSYNTTLARKFNRDIQRIMSDTTYLDLFPKSCLNSKNVVTVNSYLKNSDEFEIVNAKGGLKAVGRGAGLTGFSVDVAILDDIYKDLSEANSPVIRDNAWDWYASVIRTRLHNDSQELIVFTRWHNDDIIGRISKTEKIHELTDLDEIENISKDTWIKVNFEAIKESDATNIDLRVKGEPLYPNKHSLNKLLEAKNLDSEVFDCLYQGNPISKKGLLYNEFKIYDTLPSEIRIKKNYTDVADKGSDFLCSINYAVGFDDYIYILDLVYTDEGMEKTEEWCKSLLLKDNINEADIESNNGGRSFARYLRENTNTFINDFHQTFNKESRIISNASNVNNKILMPSDWKYRFPVFYEHISKFKRVFNSNKHDDCADALTGVYEYNDKVNGGGIIW